MVRYSAGGALAIDPGRMPQLLHAVPRRMCAIILTDLFATFSPHFCSLCVLCGTWQLAHQVINLGLIVTSALMYVTLAKFERHLITSLETPVSLFLLSPVSSAPQTIQESASTCNSDGELGEKRRTSFFFLASPAKINACSNMNTTAYQ